MKFDKLQGYLGDELTLDIYSDNPEVIKEIESKFRQYKIVIKKAVQGNITTIAFAKINDNLQAALLKAINTIPAIQSGDVKIKLEEY